MRAALAGDFIDMLDLGKQQALDHACARCGMGGIVPINFQTHRDRPRDLKARPNRCRETTLAGIDHRPRYEPAPEYSCQGSVSDGRIGLKWSSRTATPFSIAGSRLFACMPLKGSHLRPVEHGRRYIDG